MRKQTISLESVKTIAVTLYPALGDGLIFMILAHNLRCSGFKVTAFSNFMASLRSYFPEEDIQPYPDPSSQSNLLRSFDLLVYTHYESIPPELDKHDPRIIVLLDYQVFRHPAKPMAMADIMTSVCKQVFGLVNAVKANGMRPYTHQQFRQHQQRIIIHPSASTQNKQWLKKRFIKLAQRLQQRGYEPVFVIAAHEKVSFSWIFEHHFPCVANPTLDALPQLIHESGWFIGNDSGIGHLASNLGIPSITLAGRRGTATRWQPGWAANVLLLPWMPLFRWTWKQRYWKYFISVSRVLKTLAKLTKIDAQKTSTYC